MYKNLLLLLCQLKKSLNQEEKMLEVQKIIQSCPVSCTIIIIHEGDQVLLD